MRCSCDIDSVVDESDAKVAFLAQVPDRISARNSSQLLYSIRVKKGVLEIQV